MPPVTLVLSGVPFSGKSTLGRSLALLASAKGLRVRWVNQDETSGRPAFLTALRRVGADPDVDLIIIDKVNVSAEQLDDYASLTPAALLRTYHPRDGNAPDTKPLHLIAECLRRARLRGAAHRSLKPGEVDIEPIVRRFAGDAQASLAALLRERGAGGSSSNSGGQAASAVAAAASSGSGDVFAAAASTALRSPRPGLPPLVLVDVRLTPSAALEHVLRTLGQEGGGLNVLPPALGATGACSATDITGAVAGAAAFETQLRGGGGLAVKTPFPAILLCPSRLAAAAAPTKYWCLRLLPTARRKLLSWLPGGLGLDPFAHAEADWPAGEGGAAAVEEGGWTSTSPEPDAAAALLLGSVYSASLEQETTALSLLPGLATPKALQPELHATLYYASGAVDPAAEATLTKLVCSHGGDGDSGPWAAGLTALGIAWDARIAAVLLAALPHCGNRFPHITLGARAGIGAEYSNDLLATRFPGVYAAGGMGAPGAGDSIRDGGALLPDAGCRAAYLPFPEPIVLPPGSFYLVRL